MLNCCVFSLNLFIFLDFVVFMGKLIFIYFNWNCSVVLLGIYCFKYCKILMVKLLKYNYDKIMIKILFFCCFVRKFDSNWNF